MSDDDLRAELAAVRAEAADLRDIIEEAHRTCDRLGAPVRPVRPLTMRIEAVATVRLEALRGPVESIKEWIREDGGIPEGTIDLSFREIDAALSGSDVRRLADSPTWNPMAQRFAP